MPFWGVRLEMASERSVDSVWYVGTPRGASHWRGAIDWELGIRNASSHTESSNAKIPEV